MLYKCLAKQTSLRAQPGAHAQRKCKAFSFTPCDLKQKTSAPLLALDCFAGAVPCLCRALGNRIERSLSTCLGWGCNGRCFRLLREPKAAEGRWSVELSERCCAGTGAPCAWKAEIPGNRQKDALGWWHNVLAKLGDLLKQQGCSAVGKRMSNSAPLGLFWGPEEACCAHYFFTFHKPRGFLSNGICLLIGKGLLLLEVQEERWFFILWSFFLALVLVLSQFRVNFDTLGELK